jgi:two-component system sensor histidine kinase/response regulator
MFSRYTRLSAQPTGGEPSTGLGLSIAKRLVDQNNGALELISPPHTGAEFRMSFALLR